MTTTVPFKLPYIPQGRQEELYDANKRYLLACIGRQFGKTTIGLLRMFRRAFLKPNSRQWWVAPVSLQAREAFGEALTNYRPSIKYKNETRLQLVLHNNAVIDFKGSDKPDNLRGATLDWCTIDEYAGTRRNVWQEILSPMLDVRDGGCDFLFTPKGKNHVYEHWLKAKQEKDSICIQARSCDSPTYPMEAYERKRRTLPQRIFQQEHEAMFLDNAGEVFRGYMDCIKGSFAKPQSDRSYLIGVDLAKDVDFTVIIVMDANTGHVIHFDRFNEISWKIQVSRILAITKKYSNSVMYLDATSVGSPIFEALADKGINVIGIQFNNANKSNMVTKLSLLLEQGDISFPEIPVLIDELSIFSQSTLPSGRTKYSAPEGYHDDCVVALFLAVWGLEVFGRIDYDNLLAVYD